MRPPECPLYRPEIFFPVGYFPTLLQIIKTSIALPEGSHRFRRP